MRQVELGQLNPSDNTVWMIDEAAMMDTHRMAGLLQVTGNGRIVMVGDSAQLSPIGAAGWYAESVADHGSVHLSQVFRQRDERDVADYKLIREGQGSQAVQNLDARGRVHVSADKATRLGNVMADYKGLRESGYEASQVRQVIETSNHDVDTMNRFVQRDRLARQEISDRGFQVEDTEQGRRWSIHNNDQVIFLKAHQEGRVTVRNGTTGVVKAINSRGEVAIDTGKETVVVHLEPRKHSQPLGLAYAQHAQKLQGGEVDHVQVLPGSEHTANANSGYSQMTRAKHEAHVYLDAESFPGDSVAGLGKAWEQRDEPRSAQWHAAQVVEELAYTHEQPDEPAQEEHIGNMADYFMQRVYERQQQERAEQEVGMSR